MTGQAPPARPRTTDLAREATATLPARLDAWWRDRATARAGVDEASALDRLLPAAAALSDAFTTDRPDERFPAYLQSPELLEAYGLTFFPRSFHRAAWTLAEVVARGWFPRGPEARILDLGAGPAPAGIAAAAVLRAGASALGLPLPHLAVVAADHAGPALAAGRELAAVAALPGLSFHAVPTDLSRPGREPPGGARADLVVACLVLNELVAAPGGPDDASTDEAALRHLRAWARWVAPGGRLVILEPAEPGVARRLQRLRAPLVAAGLRVHAPCLHEHACPLLAERGSACHEVRHAPPEAGAEYLNRRLHRRVSELRWSFLVLGEDAPPRPSGPAAETGRLVAPFAKLKGRFLTKACAADGELHGWDLPAKLVDRAAEALLPERGDLVRVDAPTPLGGERQHRLAAPPTPSC